MSGFRTGGEMAVGIYSGEQKLESKAAKEICGRKSQEFWWWWIFRAPLHCPEAHAGQTDFKVCHRLGKVAAAEIEDLVKPAQFADP